VFGAWGFAWREVAPVGDAALEPFERGARWPDAPVLVRAEGEPAVHVLDGEVKRHVESPAVMEAWGFSFDDVRSESAETVDGWETGPAWMPEPFYLRGDGATVYVVDRAPLPDGEEGEGEIPTTGPDGGTPGSEPTDPGPAGDAGPAWGDGSAGSPVADDDHLRGGCAAAGRAPAGGKLALLAVLVAGLLWRRRRP